MKFIFQLSLILFLFNCSEDESLSKISECRKNCNLYCQVKAFCDGVKSTINSCSDDCMRNTTKGDSETENSKLLETCKKEHKQMADLKAYEAIKEIIPPDSEEVVKLCADFSQPVPTCEYQGEKYCQAWEYCKSEKPKHCKSAWFSHWIRGKKYEDSEKQCAQEKSNVDFLITAKSQGRKTNEKDVQKNCNIIVK